MSVRPIRRVTQATPAIEGAGVRLRRAFGFGRTNDFDPFLLLDDLRNERPEDYRAGFPWHPHRGIETITYVLAGSVEHRDHLGNRGVLGAGDVQWMTAGSGIIHQEMPEGDPGGRMHGFQLWANLPSALKMTKPRYQDVPGRDIPEAVDDDGTRVRVVCGSFWGKQGPVEGIAADPRYLDVSVPPGHRKRLPVETSRHAFAYVFDGFGLVPRRVGAAGCADRGDRGRPGRGARPGGHQSLPGALRQRRRGRRPSGGPGHPVPARVGHAARGAGRVVRPDCHEHRGAAAGGIPRAAGRDLPQGPLTARRCRPGRAGPGRPVRSVAAPASRAAGVPAVARCAQLTRVGGISLHGFYSDHPPLHRPELLTGQARISLSVAP